MSLSTVLKDLGMSDKEVETYLTILQSGPSPVRRIAEKAGINRGTAYDILRSLEERGLVSYYHKAKHRYFVAEDPEKLKESIATKQAELETSLQKLDAVLPEMKSLYDNAGDKPVTRYYEGAKAVKTVLSDVLETLTSRGEKEYVVYSSVDVRQDLYKAFPNFNERRLEAGIKVRVLAIGRGGELVGLDERRWLSSDTGAPAYILVYAHKVSMISLDARGNPRGVIVEDSSLAETHNVLFNWSWERAK